VHFSFFQIVLGLRLRKLLSHSFELHFEVGQLISQSVVFLSLGYFLFLKILELLLLAISVNDDRLDLAGNGGVPDFDFVVFLL
jgi:hypothetical protein